MKYWPIIIVSCAITITVCFFNILLCLDMDELRTQVKQRDSLITKTFASDSVACDHATKYLQKMSQHIQPNCSIMAGNKKISIDEFIAMYSSLVDENQQCLDQRLEDQKYINTLKDSINFFNNQKAVIERFYDIKIKAFLINGKRDFSIDTRKVDSAFILLDLYRSKMSYDSTKKMWYVKR